jgi:hypothetical protein
MSPSLSRKTSPGGHASRRLEKKQVVSRLLGGILRERMVEKGVMRRALSRKPFLKTDGRYLSREESHDRTRLR